MYCAKCDRWENDQIAIEDGICLRCYGPLVEPDDDDEWVSEQGQADEQG